MARAKSTDRADARRRNRAYLEQEEAGDESTAEETPTAASKSKPRPANDQPAIRPGQKVGFGQAFKLASRQVHYREDVSFLPLLILRTNAVWIPAAISLAALLWGLTRTDYNDASVSLILGLLLAGGGASSPAIIQPLVAGYFAPRASWLAGMISGLISSICFTILAVVWFAPDSPLANMPADRPIIDMTNVASLAIPSIASAVTFGALLGAASAWYKRFLYLMGPARVQAAPSKSGQKGRR